MQRIIATFLRLSDRDGMEVREHVKVGEGLEEGLQEGLSGAGSTKDKSAVNNHNRYSKASHLFASQKRNVWQQGDSVVRSRYRTCQNQTVP